jgi:hypothetical protein
VQTYGKIASSLYAIKFELEEFGQNVSHLTRKTYYTHNFFTDRQVFAGITHSFLFRGLEKYEAEKVPCTFAIPLDVKKHRTFFSITNANLQKEQMTAKLKIITEGNHKFKSPGSKFLALSFIEPVNDALFIGKKSALAHIEKKEKVVFAEKKDDWTTEDMISLREYEDEKNKTVFGVRLSDASTRYLVGQFKVSTLIETEFEGRKYRFYSLWKRYSEMVASKPI